MSSMYPFASISSKYISALHWWCWSAEQQLHSPASLSVRPWTPKEGHPWPSSTGGQETHSRDLSCQRVWPRRECQSRSAGCLKLMGEVGLKQKGILGSVRLVPLCSIDVGLYPVQATLLMTPPIHRGTGQVGIVGPLEKSVGENLTIFL